ncbi:MAG TPA: MFS transporter [Pseudonocardiaceae bacterium]|nr:MFS transporter [Pseudonocardiaceae bacterium]
MAWTPTQRSVLALTSISALMITLDAMVVSTALNTIRTDLGASVEALEWTINAYILSYAVLMMTGAALGDRLGRRRIFVAGLVLFTLASVACALAPDIGLLITARVVQGAGGALMMPLAMALTSAAFGPDQRAKALGVFSGVMGLGVLAGPVVGGVMVQALSWQWIFWINVPIGVVLVALVRLRITESAGADGRLDITGVTLFTGAAFGVVWALVRGNSAGWGSAEVAGALAGGVVLAIGFVAWERRAAAPMLPLRLFGIRAFTASNVAGFFLFASNLSAVFFIAQYFQTDLGYSPLGAGLRTVPWTATLFVVAPVAGGLVARWGARRLVVGGLLLQAAGMAAVAWLAAAGAGYAAMVVPLVVSGAGISAAMPATQNGAVSSVPGAMIGKASGAFNTLRQLGGGFGVAITVAVFAGTGGYGTPAAFTDGFVPAMAVSAALGVVAAAAGLALGGTRKTAVRAPRRVLVESGSIDA